MGDVEEIIDFIVRQGDGLYSNLQRDLLKDIVRKHLQYGTFLVVRDLEGIVACCRWNWISENMVWVLDLVVKKDYRKPHFLRELLALGVSKNPQCKFIQFGRGVKYPNRNKRIYSVDKFLKRRVK